MTNRGTARRMKITIEKEEVPTPTREGKLNSLSHKERHPNDKGIRRENKNVNYKRGKARKVPAWIKKQDVRLVIAWNSIYNAMEIGDACPKCEVKGRTGTIIWKGRTKHRPLHPRCNNGCLVIFTGDEINTEEEE